MTRIDPDVWSRLAGERLQGEDLWARCAAPDLAPRLFAALDANGERHFLVQLRADEPDYQDDQSRGVVVLTRNLVVRNHDTGRYLDVYCHDAAGHDAFDVIGGELADRLAAQRETATECVARVLAKWRRFWGRFALQILSREEQVGLFAELWFLSVWLVPRVGRMEAVSRWRGPFAARHDFESARDSVEVKATTSSQGRVHRISGLDQLVPPTSGDLLLFSLRVREEGGATNSLPTLVASCRGQLSGDALAMDQFDKALTAAGYSPAHEYEYAKLRLRIVEEGLYTVRADFPRLTKAQLTPGLPSGVDRVCYEINLSGFDHLCVASRPGDATMLI